MGKHLKSKNGIEVLLKPVSLVGVLVRRKASLDRKDYVYKLITLGGVEYSILTDSEWERVLHKYQWEDVRVTGLLNPDALTIVPQWVVPRGPTGEAARVSDEPVGHERDLLSKIRKTLSDLVLTPAFA